MNFPSQRVAKSEFAELLRTASRAAQSAAEVVRERAGNLQLIDWHEKSPTDFVSEVDTLAEARIASVISKDFPQATIVGEELTPTSAASSGVTFIVDPLDGTTNFLHGYPQYAVSIGVEVDGNLVAGVIRDVVRNEEYVAAMGAGAYRDGAVLRVSDITAPRRALVGTGFPFRHPHLIDGYLRQFARVLAVTAGVRRAGAAALDLCDVAAGRFEAFWELHLSPWDVAAGVVLIREAGGVVTDLQGSPASATTGGLVAGSPVMHEWLLALIGSE
ncbi:MAG: Inositol-1-monophosphatase [Gemmatimonadaceae bacterium]|nr:Inositol-1-monophosphatase [Gemmatimonadaceae bacterium]